MELIETPNQLDQGDREMTQDRELTDNELDAVSGGVDWNLAAKVAAGVYSAFVDTFNQYLKTQADSLKSAAQT